MHQLIAYKIEVLEFDRPNDTRRTDAVIPDMEGTHVCPRCGWEGERQKTCPKCDNRNIVPKGRIKTVDRAPIAPRRTLVELFYKYEQALKWGRRYGTVISCQKVDKSYYLENIEHLNLKQEPISIEIEREDFVLNKALELERPRKTFNGHEINIEIVDE